MSETHTSTHSSGPGERPLVEQVRSGYAFEGPSLPLGALMTASDQQTDVEIRVPLTTLDRHGLVAGAPGSGRTRTVQLLAEQLSAHGVPVLAPDAKGELSGLASAGRRDDDVTARATAVGQQWTPVGYPVEHFVLGSEGTGVPLRVAMSSFGPTLLARVLGLNATEESALVLLFGYADGAGLPLLDVADLRAVLHFLVSDNGKHELEQLGGTVSATIDAILREVTLLADEGADAFFGEPGLETADLLRVDADGRGLISLVERPDLPGRPALASAFLLWLLADLVHELPEADAPRVPRLVMVVDEVEALFAEASQAFCDAVARLLQLLRRRGVGVLLVAGSPAEVPDEVLAELGSRVQHRLGADDPEAVRAAVDTCPTSGYDDLGQVLTSLGTGEAVVTVTDERGDRTPPAWTRLRAPESLMGPVDPEVVTATFVGSPLKGKYATPVERESAREQLAHRLTQGADKARAERGAVDDAGKAPDPALHPEPVEAPRSAAARQLMRLNAREVARGVLGIGRR